MPFLDMNSTEAAPFVVLGFALIIAALVQVWRHVESARARVIWVLVTFALPLVGSVCALVWTRQARTRSHRAV